MKTFLTLMVLFGFTTGNASASDFLRRFGMVGVTELGGDAFGYKSNWPVAPGLGIAYEAPLHENISWIFDLAYQYKTYSYFTDPEDSSDYRRAFYAQDTVYEIFHDKEKRAHSFVLRIAPMFTSFKYLYYGMGYNVVWEYEETTGYQTYRYWYPEQGAQVYNILPSRSLSIGQNLSLQAGANFGRFRIETIVGQRTAGYGAKVVLHYFPWRGN